MITKVRQHLSTLSAKHRAIIVLCLLLPAPLIGVLCSFYMPTFGKVIWGFSKIWILFLPTVWFLYVEYGKLSWSATTKKGIAAGLLWSFPVAIVILSTYYFFGSELIDESAKAKIDELGITSPWTFLLFATAMSLGNSLMEEYVWRWFVFTKFKTLVGIWPAIVLSSVFFTVHHVVIMWNFGSISLVLVGSVGLCIGGIVWGWLYQKYTSIWPGWVCHVVADSAIMWITWTIITGN